MLAPPPRHPPAASAQDEQVGILVLEDEPSTMDLVLHYLNAGAAGRSRVLAADHLAAALDYLSRGRVDLVIADLHLPDSRGLDTVEALRKAGDQLIIVLTGDDDPTLRAGAIERGAYDFLHKSQLGEAALGRLVRLAELQARTRRSLRASEARLNAIIEAEPECVKLLDAGGNLLEMNPAGLRMIESESLDPVRGYCVYDLVDPRHRQGFRELVARVAGGEPGRLQFEIVGLKGTRRWLETHAVPFADPATGRPLVLGVTRDITEGKKLELRSERLARMYAALSASNEAILRAADAGELFRSVCDAVVQHGKFLAAGVLLAAEGGQGRLHTVAGPLRDYLLSIRGSVEAAPADGRGLIGEAFRQRRAAIANDYLDDPRSLRQDAARSLGIASAAAYPLMAAGRPLGALLLYSADVAAFDSEMAALMGRIADNAGFALEHFEREAERRRAESLLALEHSVTRCLADAEAVDDALREVMRAICEAGGWDAARYFRLDEGEATMRFAAAWSAGDGALSRFNDASQGLSYRRGAGLVGRAWASGEPLWCSDATRDPRVSEGALAREAGVHGAMVFPVSFERRILGVLSISSREVREPDERLLRTMRVIGSQLGQFLTRKRAESALRESEARFRETFELAASGIAHLSLDGRFLRVNSRLCSMLGYRAEELVGRSAPDMSHPEDRDLTRQERGRMHAGEVESARFEKRYMHKDGSVVWVNLAIALARDKLGAPQYEIAVMEDISARKETERARMRAEEALRSSEARFRSLAELSSDWYWEQDESLRFVATAGASPARGGITAEAHLGKCRWELPGTEPVSQTWEEHRAVLEARKPFRDLLLRRTLPGKEPNYISVSGTPIVDAEGRFRGYRGVARDVTLLRQGEEDLRRFRAAMDMSADAIYLIDRDAMRFVDVNEAACKGVGRGRSELLAMGPQELLRVPRAELERIYDEVIASGAAGMRSESTYFTKKGRKRWFEVYRRALRTGQGWIILSVTRDITDRKMAEERQAAHIRHQERIARFGQFALGKRQAGELIAEAIQNVLEGLGAETVAYAEPGPGEDELVFRAVAGGPAPEGGSGKLTTRSEPLRGAVMVPVRGDGEPRGMLCVFTPQARALAAEEANFVDAAASVLSSALQRLDTEDRLAYLAQFDPLTGLPNRALLSDRFSQMIVQARRRGSSLGALFIDLDEFKMVNDTLGHTGGDELLRQVAARLQASVRPGDTVARISGDEFAVVLGDLARPEDASLVAQKILDRLGQAVEIRGHEVFVTGSVGIALFPEDGTDAESLLGAADAAMYRAKQSGRNAFQFFTAEINQRSRARAQLGTELRHALEREEFFLVYQPKVELSSGRPSGAEALLRWKHPERGVVPPAEFITVLEETGLIVPVGEWVLRRACEDLKAWQAAGVQPGRVSVNLSARQFRLPDLDARLKAIVGAAGAAPELIELEITESQLVQDPDHAIRMMRSLREAGMRIAIDDFGTGYSSLSTLTRFPVGSLKIDRSFVRDVIDDTNDATIVRTIIEMAHTLGFTVVAEGIETEAQAQYLRRHGCEEGQGFLFARPMAAEELSRWRDTPRGRGRGRRSRGS
jgi:diguanylate cyclase (GGDEF)-like protein/PAS domain S-box-containing protein